MSPGAQRAVMSHLMRVETEARVPTRRVIKEVRTSAANVVALPQSVQELVLRLPQDQKQLSRGVEVVPRGENFRRTGKLLQELLPLCQFSLYTSHGLSDRGRFWPLALLARPDDSIGY